MISRTWPILSLSCSPSLTLSSTVGNETKDSVARQCQWRHIIKAKDYNDFIVWCVSLVITFLTFSSRIGPSLKGIRMRILPSFCPSLASSIPSEWFVPFPFYIIEVSRRHSSFIHRFFDPCVYRSSWATLAIDPGRILLGSTLVPCSSAVWQRPQCPSFLNRTAGLPLAPASLACVLLPITLWPQ